MAPARALYWGGGVVLGGVVGWSVEVTDGEGDVVGPVRRLYEGDQLLDLLLADVGVGARRAAASLAEEVVPGDQVGAVHLEVAGGADVDLG